MGPTKAPRLVKKSVCKVSGEWPDKDVADASKMKVKKRKLSDMLDYQWTKEELKQFYNAYRMHGKNWKKVAGLMQNKSLDMVKSLYNLKRAYLSLPEGMATVDGFLAMMADHYENLDVNNGGYKRNGAVKTLKPLKPPKCYRGKCPPDISKGSVGHHLQNQSAQSSYKCMQKKYSEGLFTGQWPHAFGKRTPRIPIIHNQGDGGNSFSSDKNIIKPAPDEDICTATLTLMEVFHGGVSPPVSGLPGRSVLIPRVKENHCEADLATSTYIDVGLHNNCPQGYLGRMEVDNGVFGRDARILDINGVDQSGTLYEVKMPQEMRPKVPGTDNCKCSDVGKAFPDRRKGFKSRKFKDKIDNVLLEQTIGKYSPPPGTREKSHLPFLEGSSLDPLQMLANVSLDIGLQAPACESDPALHGGKQKGQNDSSYHPSVPGALPADPETGNSKMSVQGDRSHPSFSVQKSNLPGSLTSILGSVNSRISFRGDKEYSSTVTCKYSVPESLTANPKNDKSKIIVQGDQELSSIVRCGGVPLKQAIFPDKISIGKDISEAEDAKCPCVSTTQHGFAANRQNPEVDNKESSLDECEKKEGIDCMLNPCNKIPRQPINQNGVGGTFCKMFSGKKPDGCLKACEMRHPTNLAKLPKEPYERADFNEVVVPNQSLDEDGTFINPSSKITCITSMKQGNRVDASVNDKAAVSEEIVALLHTTGSQTCTLARTQSMESGIKAIADLTRALDKKEEVLKELRHINDVVSRKRMGREFALNSKHVIEQYSGIVKLLNEVNNEVTSASRNLRQQHNTYNNSTSSQLRSLENSTEYAGPSGTLIPKHLSTQDSGSHVMEIVMTSRQKARTMVDAAVLAMSFLKGGEDADKRIREALDSTDSQQHGGDSNKLGARYNRSYPWSYQNQEGSFTATVNAPDSRACLSSANESQILSGLISDCIATVFMLQATSERRYPPADVVRILDHAVESLQPRCSQNLPVYRDIEKYMGYIKTQMLSLVGNTRC